MESIMRSDAPRADAATVPLSGRWVASPGSDLAYTAGGLLDTRRMRSTYYTGDRPTAASDLVDSGSYVLLAAGGAGKTTVLDQLREAESGSATVDLLVLTLDSLPAAIRTATTESDSVFIDSLDEALQAEPRFARLLARLIEQAPDHVRWRIACRPASWSTGIANALKSTSSSFRELDLLPLDRDAVELMAGADADAFMTAAERVRLTPLLARPLDVGDLLVQWRRSGDLPATRSESMRYSIERLLRETDAGFRAPQRQDEQRMMHLAEHLAAVAMFCGVSRFTPVGESSVLDGTAAAVTAIPPNEDPDLVGGTASADELREVLATSLYSTSAHGSVTIRHQAYAEFLAARLLTRRRVGGRRLAVLLGADVNGAAAGPMVEVLGWMLATAADVPTELIDVNARELLDTAGLELADQATRARIVMALLDGAANGTVDEGWGVNTTALAHPGLATQLHDATGAATSMWEVFWISRIAKHCLVFDAADDLLALAHDSRWPAHIRAEAVESFAAVAPVDRRGELTDLLDLPEDEDPDDDILAASMQSLIGVIDAADVAAAIRARRAQNYIGAYSTLLSEMASHVPPKDALTILETVIPAHGASDDHNMGRLIVGLTAAVWGRADPAELNRLGHLIGDRREIRGLRTSSQPMPWVLADRPADRLTVAVAALHRHTSARLTVLKLGLLTPTDVIAILDWMPTAAPEDVAATLSVLHHLTRQPQDAATADRVLDVPADHPAYEILSDRRGHTNIADRPEEALDDAAAQPTIESLIADLREDIEAARHDLDRWPNVVLGLSGGADHGTVSEQFRWDLTAHPLWAHLDTADTDAIRELGLGYLRHHRPDVTTWRVHGGYSNAAPPGWVGVAVLGTAALHCPDLLADLTDHVWEDWAAAILATPTFEGATDALQALRAGANPVLRTSISAAVAALAATKPSDLLSHPWGSDLDSAAIDALRTFALDEDAPRHERDTAIAALRDREPARALTVARLLQAVETDPPEEATATWAALAPEECATELLKAGSLANLTAITQLNVDGLSDPTLNAFADLILSRPEPPAPAKKPRRGGFHPSTPESWLQRTEQHVLDVLAARGMVADLTRLADGPAATRAVEPYIRHILRRARQQEANNNWEPIEPTALNHVLTDGDARLIRNNDGLMTVLLEQLDAIQHDLHERMLYRSVWDGEPGGADATPKIEDDISDWLAHELRLRLAPHVVVDRELQVSRPKHAGIGTRIDITVTSPAGRELARIAFEAKRIEHNELLTALDDQLVDRYMKPADLTHGIYLVYWVRLDRRPSRWKKHFPDRQALVDNLTTQAEAHLPARHVRVVVLDIGPSAV
ncbi:hypothetical protein [Nocardioides zeae]